MTKIFLLNPPGKNLIRTGRLVRESKNHTQSWPPIFLAYSTGVLEKMGYECMIYDASVKCDSYDKTRNIIEGYNPECIAYYWAYDSRKQDLEFADKLAEKHRVILVGPWSAHYPIALNDCPNVESMTHGSFDFTLVDLIEKRSAKGVTYQDGTHIPQGEPYTRAELDWMPYVSDVYKRHLNIADYHQTSFKHPFSDLFSGGMGACPYRCLEEKTIITMSDLTKKELKNVQTGDKLKTYNDSGIVTNKKQFLEQTLKIKISNGVEIISSLDHKFYTKRGWVMAKNLKKTDMIMYDI